MESNQKTQEWIKENKQYFNLPNEENSQQIDDNTEKYNMIGRLLIFAGCISKNQTYE